MIVLAVALGIGGTALGAEPSKTPAPAGQKKDSPIEVKFSQNRGFFERPFNLQLTASGAEVEIRYTTDGTLPSPTNGVLYNGPIKVEGTTVLRAAAIKKGSKETKIKSHSFIFPADVIRQSSDGLPPAGWHYT